ncbi:MAG TPA: 16S rRNA (cytidine(1402)-2'-O)-methyltransferase [Polyangia bacterium]|jgi:16S rRNA (cytidine1402-2'-O)-methyltransferase|nr:16S rRNA (cytidine(1402)-2'-O)-methyltransferase [Polyangia bacterium]
MAPGTLAVVATPLGDARDLSPRAAETLRAADLIVAEDTRSARRLLAEIGAGRKTILSCFDANEAARAAEVAEQLGAGATVALISEAGTPLVSDPGYRIVVAAIAAGARVVPIPGPSALLAALVGAGLPTDRFLFLGFPPRKSGARRRLFEGVRSLPYTLVLYESPLRAGATLADLAAVLGADRRACLARELTKPYEELVRDGLAALAARYATDRPLGEVTLVVEGAPENAAAEELDDDELRARAAELTAAGRSTGDAARALAEITGRPRREIYNLISRGNPSPRDENDAG